MQNVIDNAELRTLLPHGGNMCLLDEIQRWDNDSIVCSSTTHRSDANPLCNHGRLTAVHGLEYGAQAAAVHSGLLSRGHAKKLQRGVVAAFRDVRLFVERLDSIESSLEISAQRLMGEAGNQIYTTRISAAGRLLVSGRIIVMIPREGA